MGQKSTLSISSEYVNKTEKVGGTWTKTNSYRDIEALSVVIFSREIFYGTIVSCLNILWLKSVSEITARQTRKRDILKVCNMEYLTTEMELVLQAFKSWTLHKNIEYLTLRLLSSLWNIHDSTAAYFFDPPCTRLCSASYVSCQRDHERQRHWKIGGRRSSAEDARIEAP